MGTWDHTSRLAENWKHSRVSERPGTHRQASGPHTHTQNHFAGDIFREVAEHSNDPGSRGSNHRLLNPGHLLMIIVSGTFLGLPRTQHFHSDYSFRKEDNTGTHALLIVDGIGFTMYIRSGFRPQEYNSIRPMNVQKKREAWSYWSALINNWKVSTLLICFSFQCGLHHLIYV